MQNFSKLLSPLMNKLFPSLINISTSLIVLFVVLLIFILFIFFIKNFPFALINNSFDKQVLIFKNLSKNIFNHKFITNKNKANPTKNRYEIGKLNNIDAKIEPKNKLNDSDKNAFSLRFISFIEV